jgi:hypothetical protein
MEISTVAGVAQNREGIAIAAQVAMAVVAKTLDANRQEGAALVALLDPSVGKRLNASA